MTKPLTTIALLILVEEGHALLSDPVAKYLPQFRDMRVFAGTNSTGMTTTVPANRPITIHDLLTHTAGLGGYGSFYGQPVDDMFRASGIFERTTRMAVTLDEMAARTAAIPLASQPGARWRYSIASDIVGYLVQVISGVPFADYMDERIFQPLGMRDTGFFVPATSIDRFAICYIPDPAGDYVLADASFTNDYLQRDRTPNGGGGLVSTVPDYLRFAQMLLNGGELDGVRIVGRKTVELMTANHLPTSLLPILAGSFQWPGHGFGLGVCVRLGHESGTLGSAGMYGWDGAAGTRFRVDPVEDLIFIYVTQLLAPPDPIAAVYQNLVYQALIK